MLSMERMSLKGTWQLRQVGTEDWLPGQVPGDVHTALMAAGRIPDPFVADNELAVQWVAETDWEYRLSFTPGQHLLAADQVRLHCDGLDTIAEVSLNGQPVGLANNMFREWDWEVKRLLREGENELRITFTGPVSYVRPLQEANPMNLMAGIIPGGPHLRKAPCHFGWDWGPMLPPIGIWKDIRLEGFNAARLDTVHLRQSLADGQGRLTAAVQLDRWGDAPLSAVMHVTAPDGQTWEQAVEVQGQSAALAVDVPDAQIWWPNGYGAQPLYNVEVTLKAGEQQLDRRSYRIGFRTIELRREPDQWGESFTFFVNGVEVFAKGSDWIPADSFPTRITDAHLDYLLRSAAEAHMNMLRIWGGGFYEEERFYDLCDQYGILVWQDFTFACHIYPADDDFAENVRVEAVQNVRRLRHRTSLALWCGNNEMEQGWCDWGWNKPEDHRNQRLKAGYDRMFHQMLPQVVAVEDPDTVYWPSSASSGIPFAQPNSQDRGDCHYWDVWHGRKPFTAYRSQFPRFMSEFGFQALPPLETIKTYAEEKDRNMTSYVMEHHQRSGAGNGLMIHQMSETFRMPKDFSALVYLSMVLQAEGIRYGVEHWRRNRSRVSGTLIWQLNDCWPVASWASLDYYGRWKALHYAAKRFYEPVMMSIEDVGTSMSVHVTSDLVDEWTGQVQWTLETLDGQMLDSGAQEVTAVPLANTPLFIRDFAGQVQDTNRRALIFTCQLLKDGQLRTCSIATFAASKHLELVDPGLLAAASAADGQLSIQLSTASLARFVELALEGTDVVFSDNYFDLPASCQRTIPAPLPAGWTPEQAQAALRVRSLYDSF
jgi:beta-mannosidase